MQCCMYEMKCEDNLNVCKHLEDLMSKQEQLTEMNTGLTNDDLITIILGSLPKLYCPLINTIMMSAAHANAKLEQD